MKRNGNLWWGLVLIGLGVMFLLDNMDVIDYGDAIRTYWPAFLVVWGLIIVFSRSRSTAPSSGSRPALPVSSAKDEVKDVFNDRHDNPASDRLSYSAVFGDLSLRALSGSFKGGTVSSVFGDTLIDLSAATLAEGENALKLSGVFGDVSLMLAPSMPYALSARSLLGSIQAGGQKRDGFSSNLEIQSPEFASAGKKIHIEVSQVFGDITLTR